MMEEQSALDCHLYAQVISHEKLLITNVMFSSEWIRFGSSFRVAGPLLSVLDLIAYPPGEFQFALEPVSLRFMSLFL